MREWRDIHSQLKELAGELGGKVGELRPAGSIAATPALYAQVHRALLAGLLGNVGLKTEEASYQGARGIKFWSHPGSALAKKQPRWVMAAEITETARLYGRTVAGTDPEWIERVGAHLLKRTQQEPHWEKKAGQVVALGRGTLYGLPG